MICTCIDHKTYEQIKEILLREDLEMAEIRLDLCDLSREEISDIFSQSPVPLIATCRIQGCRNEDVAYERLSAAALSGTDFLDLEIEASSDFSDDIVRLCRDNGVRLIRSYHNFEGTPDLTELYAVTQQCFEKGADIAKVVTTANSPDDNLVVGSLYEKVDKGTLVAFSMGEIGKSSRIDALHKGAPFTYASLENGKGTAPGQICYKNYSSQIYSSLKRIDCCNYKTPSSKSYAQRAIIAAALACGESRISGFSICDDSSWALNLVSCLGAQVSQKDGLLTIKGIGASRKSVCLSTVNTGESGLLTRIMIPLISAIGCGECLITGTGTLLNRTLKGVEDTIAAFGVTASSLTASEFRVPLKIRGILQSGTVEVDGSYGSQLITGLLMSLPLIDGDSVLIVHNASSVPYIFMTLRILRCFGISIDVYSLQEGELKFEIKGGQSYKPADFCIEGDWSGAANFLVASAIGGRFSTQNLSGLSEQADKVIADVLNKAGARLIISEENICVSKSPLRPFEAELKDSPDIIPIVSLLAAFCQGVSRISGMSRLFNKESNRADAISKSFDGLGVRYEQEGDVMKVYGENLSYRLANGHLLNGGEYSSFNDHRIVMMLKVASLFASSTIRIDDESCVNKSYPGFINDFESFCR